MAEEALKAVDGCYMRRGETIENVSAHRSSILSRIALYFALGLGLTASAEAKQAARLAFPAAHVAIRKTDTIILGNFVDTGEAHLDNAWRQALWAALDESPYLNVVPDAAVEAAQRKTNHPPNSPVTGESARDVCRIIGSKIYILGSLKEQRRGARFLIELNALDCAAGKTIAYEQSVATDQAALIDVLGQAAVKLRAGLGEPSQDLDRFSTPLSRATSSSPQALRTWSLGLKTWREKGPIAALPFLSEAIQSDPSFAAAIYDLGLANRNGGEEAKARELFTKAFALQQHASARKRFAINAQYYAFVTVDYEQAVAWFKQWIESYPADYKAVSNLGSFYGDVCRYEEAIAQFEQARGMNPNDFVVHDDLMEMLLATGEFDKVREAYREMLRMGLDDDAPHLYLYVIGFLQHDTKEMTRQAVWFEGKPDLEHEILSEEADAAAYAGHLARARQLTDLAVQSALKAGNKEEAAAWLLNAAWREELFGNPELAHDQAVRALATAPDSREGEATAAIILARTGDISRAEALIRSIEARYSNHRVMRLYWLPCIRAQIALQRIDPSAALRELQSAMPLDTLYP